MLQCLKSKKTHQLGKSSRGRTHGLWKIFTAPIYRAHRAVIFAIAWLSCQNMLQCLKNKKTHQLVVSSQRLSRVFPTWVSVSVARTCCHETSWHWRCGIGASSRTPLRRTKYMITYAANCVFSTRTISSLTSLTASPVTMIGIHRYTPCLKKRANLKTKSS